MEPFTNKIAHLMPRKFIQWLIQKAKEGTWSKEEVDNILFNKEKTKEGAHLLSADFHTWLIQQANCV